MSFTKWTGHARNDKPKDKLRSGTSPLSPTTLHYYLTLAGWHGVVMTVDGKHVKP